MPFLIRELEALQSIPTSWTANSESLERRGRSRRSAGTAQNTASITAENETKLTEEAAPASTRKRKASRDFSSDNSRNIINPSASSLDRNPLNIEESSSEQREDHADDPLDASDDHPIDQDRPRKLIKLRIPTPAKPKTEKDAAKKKSARRQKSTEAKAVSPTQTGGNEGGNVSTESSGADDPADESFGEGHSDARADTDATAISSPPLAIKVRKPRKVVSSRTVPTSAQELEATMPGKPEPYGRPLIFAEGRQALCEALPYYRAYQGAPYCTSGTLRGQLLGLTSDRLAHIDEEVVITRCGGHCGRDDDGSLKQLTDQTFDEATVQSFKRSMDDSVAVVLIAGDDNKEIYTKMPHAYNVLDNFIITNMWTERNNGRKCVKVRFEKLNRRTKSWWALKDSPDVPSPLNYPPLALFLRCTLCDKAGPQVFTQGWTCLNSECLGFWLLDGVQANEEALTYNPDFLNQRINLDHVQPPYDLKLDPDLTNPGHDSASTYSRECWKGVVCPLCGCCNSRKHWDRWECDTPGCDWVCHSHAEILSARSVQPSHHRAADGWSISADSFNDTFVTPLGSTDENGWRIEGCKLADGNGIWHYLSNRPINAAPGGPDELFVELQRDNCMQLQRFEMTTKMGKGPVLASHFSCNFGMPYKYVVAVASRSFADAPAAMMSAINRMTWAAKDAIEHDNEDTDIAMLRNEQRNIEMAYQNVSRAGIPKDPRDQATALAIRDTTPIPLVPAFDPFNELLAVGYYTESKMGYHDDGEKQLGPTVATLSLGCQALMVFRMKARYYTGLTKSGHYDPTEPVLRGCLMETARRRLNASYGTLPAAEFERRRAALCQQLRSIRGKTPPAIAALELNHGDIVIMHGHEMQKYYEHAVKSTGKLRFALTCRRIRPEMVPKSEHWKADIGDNVGVPYNGVLAESG